jgi:hypothetical protein
MARGMLAASLLVIVLAGAAGPVAAQPPAGFRGPVFRIEKQPPGIHDRPGFVTGWLYNDGQGVVGLVRMRVEMLDGSGQVISTHDGWAYGNVPPGGRAYFRVPVPSQSTERRVLVESFVIQAWESP